MDNYTEKTKNWLENRFSKVDGKGIYFAHQPIYGFRKGHCESLTYHRYLITHKIILILSRLKFKSFVDIGAAEGYKAFIAKQIFNVKVKTSDVSENATELTKKIFNIDSIPADVNNLPFEDNEFDVVLCSETLEHVRNIFKPINELLRVAKKAVIITVPHETVKMVKENVRKKIPHGHIHYFDKNSYDFLKEKGYFVYHYKIISGMHTPLLILFNLIMDPRKTNFNRAPSMINKIYNSLVPILKFFIGKRMFSIFMQLDNFFSKYSPFYGNNVFLILKDKKSYNKKEIRKISAYQILNYSIPFYYLDTLHKHI